MNVMFEENYFVTRVWVDDSYWLGINNYSTQRLVAYWHTDRVKTEDYFKDINNPTPEEITIFALEFGDKLADMLFHNEKKVVFRVY